MHDETVPVLTGAVWATIAVVVGYFAYAIAQIPDGAVSFRYWVIHPIDRGVIYWAFGGGVLGAIIGYIKLIERS